MFCFSPDLKSHLTSVCRGNSSRITFCNSKTFIITLTVHSNLCKLSFLQCVCTTKLPYVHDGHVTALNHTRTQIKCENLTLASTCIVNLFLSNKYIQRTAVRDAAIYGFFAFIGLKMRYSHCCTFRSKYLTCGITREFELLSI